MAPKPPSERQLRLIDSAQRSSADKKPKHSFSSVQKKTRTTPASAPTQKTHLFPSRSSGGGNDAGETDGDDTAFNTTKRDKRQVKHSQLLHKAHTSSILSKAQIKNVKRREQKRKNNTFRQLDDLADALPAEVIVAAAEEKERQRLEGEDDGTGTGIEATASANRSGPVSALDKVTEGVRKAYSSTPGALKRREKIVIQERVVFERTLAALGMVNGSEVSETLPSQVSANIDPTSTTTTTNDMTSRTTNQWNLLRNAISTMKSG